MDVLHVERLRRAWVVVLSFTLLYLGVILALNGGDFKAFVTIGSCYSSCQFDLDQGCPEGTENGYDGQYAYYIARDPAHSIGCMDVPAYRYQRILLPALGRLLAFGDDDLIPVAFVLVNLAALVASTALLEDLLRDLGVTRWYALVYGLFFGVVVGVRLSTPEPLAYGLVMAAIGWHHRGWSWRVAWALLGAMLAKETTGLFVAGFGLFFLLHARWKDLLRLGLVVGVPFLLWQAYLLSWIGELPAGAGGGGRSAFEIIPFNGVWRILTETDSLAVFLLLGALIIPSAVVPSVWGVWATLKELGARRGKVHLYTCLCAVNAGMMWFVPFSTYREFLGMLRFLVGLVLAHLLFAALCYPRRRPLTYSTLWIVLLVFVVAG